MKEKFMNGVMSFTEFLESNLIVDTIKKVFTYSMPLVIVGSFANLFVTLVSSKTTGLASIEALSFFASLEPAFKAINFATMDVMTFYIVLLVGVIYGKARKVPEYISGALAFVTYITLVPSSIKVTIEKVTGTVAGLAPATMNSRGLFIGLIASFVTVSLFAYLMNFEKIKIKLPDSVPGFLATSFNTLIPVAITVFIVAIGGTLFLNFTGSYIGDWIYTVIQSPLQNILQSPWGIIIVAFGVSFFWVFGVHGWFALSPIVNPLMLTALADNISTTNAGGIASNPVTMGFWTSFVRIGGNGMVFCLILAILIASKREDHRSMAKIGLIPSLFYISEPMMFGLPVVLNPIFGIPFILAPMAGAAIGMAAYQFGFIGANIVNGPVNLVGIYPLMTYGTLNSFIVHIICLVVGTLIYLPFVRIANKQESKKAVVNNA